VWQLNLTENHRDGRPANLRQTHGGRSSWPDGVLHHARGHDLLVSCIIHNTPFKRIQFIEITEKDRDPNNPTRITVTVNHTVV
jgi:hypothetical protein